MDATLCGDMAVHMRKVLVIPVVCLSCCLSFYYIYCLYFAFHVIIAKDKFFLIPLICKCRYLTRFSYREVTRIRLIVCDLINCH